MYCIFKNWIIIILVTFHYVYTSLDTFLFAFTPSPSFFWPNCGTPLYNGNKTILGLPFGEVDKP